MNEPRIVARPAFLVAGLRIRVAPMDAAIPQVWGRFGPRDAKATTNASTPRRHSQRSRFTSRWCRRPPADRDRPLQARNTGEPLRIISRARVSA